MKKTIIFFTIVLCSVSYNAVSQTVSFSYDADGNMSSRTVVTLRSAEFVSEEESEEQESIPEIVSTALGEQKITVYPNPTQGTILVEIQPLNYEEENFLRLFNSQGQLLETVKIESERTPVDITGKSGVYLLDIYLGGKSSKWKIIKQ